MSDFKVVEKNGQLQLVSPREETLKMKKPSVTIKANPSTATPTTTTSMADKVKLNKLNSMGAKEIEESIKQVLGMDHPHPISSPRSTLSPRASISTISVSNSLRPLTSIKSASAVFDVAPPLPEKPSTPRSPKEKPLSPRSPKEKPPTPEKPEKSEPPSDEKTTSPSTTSSTPSSTNSSSSSASSTSSETADVGSSLPLSGDKPLVPRRPSKFNSVRNFNDSSVNHRSTDDADTITATSKAVAEGDLLCTVTVDGTAPVNESGKEELRATRKKLLMNDILADASLIKQEKERQKKLEDDIDGPSLSAANKKKSANIPTLGIKRGFVDLLDTISPRTTVKDRKELTSNPTSSSKEISRVSDKEAKETKEKKRLSSGEERKANAAAALASTSSASYSSATFRSRIKPNIDDSPVVPLPPAVPDVTKDSVSDALSAPNIKWGRSAETEELINILRMEATRINVPVKALTVEVQPKAMEEETPLSPSSPESGESGERREKRKSSRRMSVVKSGGKKQKDFVITRNEDSSDSPTIPALQVHEVNDQTDKRTQIAREILSTEKHYVHTLKVMAEHYQAPLLESIESHPELELSRQDIKELFGQLAPVVSLNITVLEEIQLRLDDWKEESSCLGDIFTKFAPYFRIYKDYSNRYDSALNMLNQLMKKPVISQYLMQLDEKTDLAPRLEGLLIAPIQRIPRYILLLSDLKKNTSENHPDFPLLISAISLMESTAEYINQELRDSANLKKMMELSLQGAKALMKPHRSLIYEGLLLDDKKVKYHIWIFNDMMLHIPEKKTSNRANLEKTEYHWPLHLVWCSFDTKKEILDITGPTYSYRFKLPIEEIAVWRDHLTRAINEHLKLFSKNEPALTDSKLNADDQRRYGLFLFPSSAQYSGWWWNGKMDGVGSYSFTGLSYEGEFEKDLKHGRGKLTHMSGEIYDGQFEYDQPHGFGVLTYPNGDIYSGEWLKGKKHGEGEFKGILGDKYNGDWSNDRPHGMGTFIYSNGSIYTGNWQYGLRFHYGVMTLPNKTRFEGMWLNNLRHGKGLLSLPDGSSYEGQWREGLREGQGISFSPLVGKYDGEWLEDVQDGRGTFEYSSGNTYVGQFKKGQYCGVGKMTYVSGLIKQYDGEWLANKKHGMGVLLFANSDRFEGAFKDDQFHGNGEYQYANTTKIVGKWNKGVVEGKCTIRGPHSDQLKVAGTIKDHSVIPQTTGLPLIPFNTTLFVSLDSW